MKAKLAGWRGGLAKTPGWLRLAGLSFMLQLLPVTASFMDNRYQVAVQDLVLPLWLCALTAVLVGVGFARMWRGDRLAGDVAAIAMTAAVSFGYEGWLAGILAFVHAPSLGDHAAMLPSVVFLGLLAAASYWFGRLVAWLVKRLGWNPREAAVALAGAVAATFLFQAVTVGVVLAREWPQFFYHPPLLNVKAATQPAAKPDIYYIVLDRYTSQDVLTRQFNFDNSDFLSFLQGHGYYINASAHNNYPYTTMSIASTMSADYLSDVVGRFGRTSQQTVVPFDRTVRNPPVASALKQLGYSYTLIANWYETSNVSPLADKTYQKTDTLEVLGRIMILNNFSKDVLMQSPVWRFLKPGLSLGGLRVFGFTDLQSVDMTHYELQSLREVADGPAGGRFIFAHLLVPHDPYFFNADGTLATNPSGDNIGKPVKEKYLGQVQYINSQMKDILAHIDTASQGKAVVVLQSDEGPYPTQLSNDFGDADEADEIKGGDMRKWTDASLAMKFGNLAAYHIPAADFAASADAADSVNVFRLVLNTYFGTGLPYLPDCYYAYPDGRARPDAFADITKRLTGQPADERCQADGSVK